MRRLLQPLLTTLLLLGPLASAAATDETASSGPKALAMAPVLAPATFTFENRGSPLSILSPLAGSLIAMQNRNRGIELSNLLRAQQVKMGEEMTRLLHDALREEGVDAALLEDPPRQADEPTTIDLSRLDPATELVLTGVFDDVGFFSGFTSSLYRPRVNVSIYLTRRRNGESVFTHSVYYGVDAKKLTNETVPADPKYAYASYDAAIGKPEELAQAMRDGMTEIAHIMARQLASEFKTNIR